MPTTAPERYDEQVEQVLYYLTLLHGRRFTGSLTLWLYDGQLTRSSLRRLRQLLRRAGVPLDGVDTETEEE